MYVISFVIMAIEACACYDATEVALPRCHKDGQDFELGSSFVDPVNPCHTCQCLPGGHYACSYTECPAVDCPADVQARNVDGCCMECLGGSPKK